MLLIHRHINVQATHISKFELQKPSPSPSRCVKSSCHDDKVLLAMSAGVWEYCIIARIGEGCGLLCAG